MGLFKRKKTETAYPAVKSDDKQRPQKAAELKAEEKPKKKAESKVEAKKSQVAYKVLIHPLITEKSNIQSSLNQYVFVVDNRASKVEIKKAIQEIYHIKPTQVRIINLLGKMVRTGRRGVLSRRKNWKKAIVTLPADKKIDVYEGV